MKTSDSPTIPTGPLPHVAMDYARLRSEGIAILGRIASGQWTDFNAHDPGITILEQLCYAITDLGYRTSLPIAELIAGAGALPAPTDVLPCDPVTRTDLRKVALDVDGVQHARTRARDEPDLACYFHAASHEIRLRPDPADPSAPSLQVHGVIRVDFDAVADGIGDPQVALMQRLHGVRPVGEDLEVVRAALMRVRVHASVEVGPIDDPQAVLAAIRAGIQEYLLPSARFVGVADALATGAPLDVVLEGPRLDHGVLLGDRLPEAPRTLNASDLIRVILDVPGTRAVHRLDLGSSESPGGGWFVEVRRGEIAVLAVGSTITLLRDGSPIPGATAVDARGAGRAPTPRPQAVASETTGDRVRVSAVHRSIQHQLPAVYGLGAIGLPASAPPRRRAAALQLEAYLLLFDQVLANAFAQLANAGRLLSPGADEVGTYFAAPVEDDTLRLGSVLQLDADDYRTWLAANVEPGDPVKRRQRLLAHLLARYAEQLGDHVLLRRETDSARDLVVDRQRFLAAYPRLGRARGTGVDLLAPDSVPSAFEERIAHKIGHGSHPDFFVVEHVLLRPILEDRGQIAADGEPEVPLLAEVADADPWSLRLTFVLRGSGDPSEQDPYLRLVGQTIRAETPAHLSAGVMWLSDDETAQDWTDTQQAWSRFRALYRERLAGPQPEGAIAFRDARDRVIDLLELGRTYPLRDLVVPGHVIVAPGTLARIPLPFSQADVQYELRDRITGAPVLLDGVPIVVDGTGGPIQIPTPPIEIDVTYRILAVKREPPGVTLPRREVWLRTAVTLEEGVDTGLVVRILSLPPLDPTHDLLRPTDARIADWGAIIEVEVVDAQEGVVYQLVEAPADPDDFDGHRRLSDPVVSLGGSVVLQSIAMTEDLELQVRGSKSVGDPPEVRRGVLTTVMPLRVRANPGIEVEVASPVIDVGADASVHIEGSQPSVAYRIWRRDVGDMDFKFREPPGVPTIDVDAGGHVVRVGRPPRPALWADLDFAPVGDAQQGNGGRLQLELPDVSADTVVLVQASKMHAASATASPTIGSSVQLERALAILLRPDAQRRLRLSAVMHDGATTGPLELHDGEPGVQYTFGPEGSADGLGRPVHVHARNAADPGRNLGIRPNVPALEQPPFDGPAPSGMRVGIDLVVARDHGGDPALVAPLPPELETAPLAAGTTLWVHARRALTTLANDLARAVVIPAAPIVHADPTEVAAGGRVRVIVDASATGDTHWLARDGVPVGVPQTGDGDALVFDTGPLDATTLFELVVRTEDPATHVVERRAQVTVVVTAE